MVDVTVQPFEIETRTRFGYLVRADVYLPPDVDGPVPVLFAASPYQKANRPLPAHWVFSFMEYGPIQLYLDQGYAYVAMDVPGSGRSEGTWDFVSLAEGEAIHDMIEFVAGQDWSRGSVGMIGMSYYCWSQWNAARTRPPSLKCLGAYDGATDMYRDWMYQGGIPVTGFLDAWLKGSVQLHHAYNGLPVDGQGRGDLHDAIYSHPFDDEWQRRRSPFWELDRIDIPVLSIGCWGKASLHLRGNTEGFARVRGPKQLLLADAPTFQAAQQLFFDEDFHRAELLPWYDHHLKGIDNGVMERPAVRYHRNGDGTLLEARTWPPEDVTIAELFLSGAYSGLEESLNNGSLATAASNDGPASTSWSYPDPQWLAGVTTFGPDMVPDHVARVVTFTSPPFETDCEFTGEGVLHLFASSDQSDMEVMAKLSLLPAAEEGPPFVKISQGWLRASHRAEEPELTREMRPFHAHQCAEPITPGEVYELRIELMPMSVLVRRGDRLRLELSNWESAITEAPMTHFYGRKVGTDCYHHSAARPSRIRLNERALGAW